MSFKRPTEISWDSDEDDELLSINTKFKADDDEELDEDALLESDDESSPVPSKPHTSVIENKKSLTTTNKPVKTSNSGSVINKVSIKTTTSRNGAPSENVSTKKTGNASSTKNKKITPIVFSDSEPEPVLILEDPEEDFEFDDSGVTEAILDSSQGEEAGNFEFTKPFEVQSTLHTTHVTVSQREEEGLEDQSDVSNLEVSVDKGQESSEESEESDHEDDRRGRFRTERQQTVKLTNHKPVGDIPDTLEISKEQEEEIEQFNKSHNKSHRGRGRGRGGSSGRGGFSGGRGGFSNRGGFTNRNGPQRRDFDQRVPPTNHNFQHNHFPTNFHQEALPSLSQPQQSHPPPPASVPQKIHINPHFRRGSMLPPRQGDGIMATPGIPPLLRPREPSMMQLQPRVPIVQSVPQSVPWTSQANPQPIFSRPPHPLHHQRQDLPPHHHYAAPQPAPRQNDPYPAYSAGPPSHVHQAPQHYVGPHHHQVPHSGPPPFHGQQYPPKEQYHPSGPPPQPMVGQPNHQYPPPHHPPQSQIRIEPQHPPHVRMGPPPHQPHSGPPQQHQHYNPQHYQEHRYPHPQRAPEPHVRPDFQPPQQTQQQQQPPIFHQRAPGYQSRPQRFHSQGQRMPQGPNTVQNNGTPRQPVIKQKQNAVLLAHAKKLRDRAKKFSQTTPIAVPSKPQKRPSTESIVESSTEHSPVKQTKVETKPMTPEDRELQEKLAQQAQQREYVRKRKEANRQALAQKKREELAQRLAGTGQTLEDIEQPLTSNAHAQQQIQSKPLHTNVAPKKTIQPIHPPQAGQQIQTVQSNQIRFQNAHISQPSQNNPQKKIVNLNKGVSRPVNTQMTTNKSITNTPKENSSKKLMKRIETVKKNAQGEIISREIKLVPIEDEEVISEQTSVTNHGQVQVVKKSTGVISTGGQQAGNRTVVSGNRSVITPGSSNRSVIRLNPDSGKDAGGDLRNVVSQQASGRRIVVKSTPKSVMVKNLSISTSDTIIKNLCTTVGPVESIKRDQKDAVVTFMNASHASLFAEKYNRTLLDLSTILVSVIQY
ncbi:RNA-binding protein 33-like [Saccostrea echinata]|uniref:RNA-binding protein 33-like n=1 Tax=Saccostrea echinata TaxID=191078 RepID=UPI002A80DA03|nr:RNA-binding protein 33-like [Saccostrea echinata]